MVLGVMLLIHVVFFTVCWKAWVLGGIHEQQLEHMFGRWFRGGIVASSL
jgi:hypothetical protein